MTFSECLERALVERDRALDHVDATATWAYLLGRAAAFAEAGGLADAGQLCAVDLTCMAQLDAAERELTALIDQLEVAAREVRGRLDTVTGPTGSPCPNGGPDHVRGVVGRRTCPVCDG